MEDAFDEVIGLALIGAAAFTAAGSVNPDGTVTVFDADGNPLSTIDAPWAYDANGTPSEI
ncbi:hypothetical protein ABIE52_000637 [Rhodococcus sp. OAS809]|uniref:hypothetical protein n=1 Tax=Rhodococcus sp. OAS809 TaxID=2663874 RepID=UPI00178B06FB